MKGGQSCRGTIFGIKMEKTKDGGALYKKLAYPLMEPPRWRTGSGRRACVELRAGHFKPPLDVVVTTAFVPCTQ